MSVTGSCVSFTFDDTYASQYVTVRPILAAKGWAASAYIIQDRLDTAGFLTTVQLAALADLNDWDIGLHAYSSTVHGAVNGNVSYSGTPGVLRDDWTSQQQALQALGLTRGLGHYAYPQGKFDATTLAEVKKRFLSARTTISRGIETIPAADLYRLRAIQCGSTTALTPNSTAGTLEWFVDQVGTYGGWLILCFHDVITTATNTQEFSTTNFQALCDYIQTSGIPVRTVGEVLGA
jgi:peptidoglycan/xylan/chitin deacetylase (PgdA/CDA1 family)